MADHGGDIGGGDIIDRPMDKGEAMEGEQAVGASASPSARVTDGSVGDQTISRRWSTKQIDACRTQW